MKKWIVRHGVMRFLGEFDAPDNLPCARGSRVVIRSERGHEAAEVLVESSPSAVQLLSEPTRGQVVRLRPRRDPRRRAPARV